MLTKALNECLYDGYRFKIVLTPERFAEDCRIHDVDLSASFLAVEGSHPVGVALVSRRGERAWIGGMGVHPSLRGRGLGTELLGRTQDRLRALGARQLLLEVLVENTAARQCYTRAGFVARRRYSCFRGTASRIDWNGNASRVSKVHPSVILADYESLHNTVACWQRELATLHHRRDELKGLVARQWHRTVATLLYSENAVADVGWDREGPPLGRPLHELLLAAFGPSRPLAIVNVPNDDPLCAVMRDGGFEVYAEQLDMACTL
jgi:GNAT superfamily N-acetyltransferase